MGLKNIKVSGFLKIGIGYVLISFISFYFNFYPLALEDVLSLK